MAALFFKGGDNLYIEPNSEIRVLKNVPLTPDYKDTLYFDSVNEQLSYFISKTAAYYTNQSYVRLEQGLIRLDIKADDLYSASYLMYRNTSYGSKWFYAFINSIEYVNDNCTLISFTIDDLQTWYFDYDTPPCLVERCHSYKDGIGDNIAPEPVDPGDMVPNGQIAMHEYHPKASTLNKPVLCVSFIDPEGSADKGHLINNIFTTGEIYTFDMSTDAGVSAAVEWLSDISEQYFDSIVGMWMIPGWAVTRNWAFDWQPNSRTGEQYTHQLPLIAPGTQLDGYVPKNNKLYTYPFNLLQINAASGSNIALKYEFFDDLTPTFLETWNLPDPVSSALRPTNYRDISGPAMDLCISLDGYPMAAWSGDAYKAWLAQNKGSRIGDYIAMITGIVLAPFTGGASAAVTVATGMKLANENYKASIAADQRGGGSSGSNAWSNSQMDYYACRMSVNANKAEIIDSYFTAYGYAQGRVMRPPRKNRRSFTYVKTDGCIVTGNIPAEAAAKIRAIYDAGIRFWANHTSFGNLNIDNYTL